MMLRLEVGAPQSAVDVRFDWASLCVRSWVWGTLLANGVRG